VSKNFKYVVGWSPYEFAARDYHTKGNGVWNATAPTMDEALKVIFGSLPFPGETTGRKFFMPGVSLEGQAAAEVIQVWSDEPEVVKRTHDWAAAIKYEEGGLWDGHGKNFGLHCEIKVTEIDRWVAPARTLLTAGDLGSDNENRQLSPMGASLLKFDEVKHELQKSIQAQRMEIAKRQWDLEEITEGMEEKVRLMEQQINVLNAYLHGTRSRTQICTGSPGKGPYHVFQERQFLSEEIGLLGNFGNDMDFEDMESMEKWLVDSGRIWKFLPFERCILATRIRKDDRDYHDPYLNWVKNALNMHNMIWVRDGQNVFHVDVEFKLTNAIFPDKDQFERALKVVREYLYTHSFKWKPPTNWHDKPLKPSEYDHDGKMRRKPLDEEEPYCTTKVVNARFHTMQDWLADEECYPEQLGTQITRQVQDYLKEVNKKQMVFAVILQGIVDNTNILEIPKGTDLFDWEVIDKYFVLLFDYSHALPWKGVANKLKPFFDQKARVGEWIVVDLHEYVSKGNYSGNDYKEKHPMLLKVVALEDGKPVVMYHPRRTKRLPGEDWNWRYVNEGARIKKPIQLVLKSSHFIKVPMPPSLAEQILDDREWKKENQWAVPFMVNYGKVLQATKKAVNGTIIKWDKPPRPD